MSNIAIRAEHLSKQYKIGVAKNKNRTLSEYLSNAVTSAFSRNGQSHFWALKDVSFEIKQGEVVGVIGNNGAGKSTLLKILSRITEPTGGFAEIHGRVGSLLEVGTGFNPELTGRENIYLSGTILGMKKAEIQRNFDAILDFSGVEKFVDTPVKRYSSGMYVRLAFAVAAHLQPAILIVDEVLAVGDMAFQRRCLGKMESVAKEGRTILFVSHNLGVVKSLCHRSLLLNSGTVQMDGPSSDVIAQYLAQSEDAFSIEPKAKIAADLTWRDSNEGEGFFLYPKNQITKIVVQCGDPIVLEFDIESPLPLDQVTIGVQFASQSGNKVVSMSSKIQSVPSASGTSCFWRVVCDMGRLPLNSGNYKVTIHVGNPLSDYARFSPAFFLTVTDHDVYGWGNPLPPSEAWGHVYWAPTWDIHPIKS